MCFDKESDLSHFENNPSRQLVPSLDEQNQYHNGVTEDQWCDKSTWSFKFMLAGITVLSLSGIAAFVYSIIKNATHSPIGPYQYKKFGYNFDPTTGTSWIHGIQLCDFKNEQGESVYAKQGLALLQAAIAAQLTVIHSLSMLTVPDGTTIPKFNTIKSFYTQYASPQTGQCQVNLAQEISRYNKQHNASLELAAGLYLFRANVDGCGQQCDAWSDAQLESIQLALVNYPVINAVVIGNEDANQLNRILHYATKLKTYRDDYGLDFAIMTAQTSGTAKQILTSDDAVIKQLRLTLDVLGVNIYPYWANVDFTDAFTNFASQYKAFSALAKKQNVALAVTETGWPSAGNRGSNSAMYNYYRWAMSQAGESLGVSSLFYFQVFDKLIANSQLTTPEDHWGLCSHDTRIGLTDAYQSCVIDSSGQQQQKQLSPDNEIVTVATDFESPIEVVVCEDGRKKNPLCGVVNGVPATSRAKKNQDLHFYSRALDFYQRVLVLWNLGKSKPPMWCEVSVSRLKQQKLLHVCWDKKHNTTQCSTSLAPC